MAFTDHCPQKIEIDKRPKIRMKYNQKQEYLDNIQNLKEKYKDIIEIQSGFENETDKIILGQHFIYDDNKNLKMFRRKI